MAWSSSPREEERDRCADSREETVSGEVGAHLMKIRTNDLYYVILSLSIPKLSKDDKMVKMPD